MRLENNQTENNFIVQSEKKIASRFIEIDSLRFIACALVIIQHAQMYFDHFSAENSLLGKIILLFNTGWLGVLIFFAISGFVIPSSLRGERLKSLKNFYMRRFWRLYPPFWMACLIIVFIDPEKYSIPNLIWRFSMLPVSDRNEFGHSSYFWTLQIELVFYFLIACLFLLFGRFSLKLLISISSMIILPFSIWIYISGQRFAPFSTFSQCLPFPILLMIWGASCREILNQNINKEVSLKNNYLYAIKLGLVTGLLTILPVHAIYFGLREWNLPQLHEGTITTLGILIFLFWAIFKPIKSISLARLGRNTYSTYLLHGAVNLVLLYFFTKLKITNWPFFALLIGALSCSLIVGEIFYRFVEAPSNLIGRKNN